MTPFYGTPLSSLLQLFGTGEVAEQHSSTLVSLVLETLCLICTFDSVSFINAERFKLSMKPIVDQLDNLRYVAVPSPADGARGSSWCRAWCANAVGDDSLWKELNTEILYRRRDKDKPQVRQGQGVRDRDTRGILAQYTIAEYDNV